MNRTLPTLSLSLALAAFAAFPAAAMAQPSERPPEPPPEDQSDISQINGQLVPVGKHNEYHYSFSRWNLSTNPLGWIVGFYGASLSYGLHDNVALRGDINYFNPPDGGATGYELGAGLPIYFRRTYQGAFLEPGVIVRRFESDAGGDGSTTMGPQILFGWHWTWDSGLNVAIAAGLGRNWATEDQDEYHYDDEEIFANGYLRFGYAF